MGKTVGNTELQGLPIILMSRSSRSCEPHFTSDQNRGKAMCRFSSILSLIFLSFTVLRKEESPLPMWLYRAYAPGSVGCCTIGLGGLVGSVFVVVVEAAPSSRVKAMIHAIMGIPSCLALLFPRTGWELGRKKFARGSVS
jgi:hypothetical protein